MTQEVDFPSPAETLTDEETKKISDYSQRKDVSLLRAYMAVLGGRESPAKEEEIINDSDFEPAVKRGLGLY